MATALIPLIEGAGVISLFFARTLNGIIAVCDGRLGRDHRLGHSRAVGGT